MLCMENRMYEREMRVVDRNVKEEMDNLEENLRKGMWIMITNKQKALLHVAKQELNLDDDLYREILHQEAGVYSSTDLTAAGYNKVMRRLRQVGFRITHQRHQADALISKQQIKLIEHMYQDMGWYDRRRQIGFNKRITGYAWPQTRADANKVIEALKAMLARQAAGGNDNGQ